MAEVDLTGKVKKKPHTHTRAEIHTWTHRGDSGFVYRLPHTEQAPEVLKETGTHD